MSKHKRQLLCEFVDCEFVEQKAKFTEKKVN